MPNNVQEQFSPATNLYTRLLSLPQLAAWLLLYDEHRPTVAALGLRNLVGWFDSSTVYFVCCLDF